MCRHGLALNKALLTKTKLYSPTLFLTKQDVNMKKYINLSIFQSYTTFEPI